MGDWVRISLRYEDPGVMRRATKKNWSARVYQISTISRNGKNFTVHGRGEEFDRKQLLKSVPPEQVRPLAPRLPPVRARELLPEEEVEPPPVVRERSRRTIIPSQRLLDIAAGDR